MKLWREVTRTPGRAALATLDLCAMAGVLISLRTIPVTTLDAQGPLRARCGLTFYVSSASNRAVDSACRYAFATRVPQLLLFALLAIAATACLVIAIARPESDERRGGRQLWRDVTRTPARAALATFDVAALVAVVAASQPVDLVTTDAGGTLRAHCGLQYFVVGAANSAVGHACRRAYAPRASVFVAMLAIFVIGVVVLSRMLRRGVPEAPDAEVRSG